MKLHFTIILYAFQTIIASNIYAQQGIITTIAGNGNPGYSGDGGEAVQAELSLPIGVCVDLNGNLYIADSSNHCVRKVDPSGMITTVAGNGTSGYSGDGSNAINSQLNNPGDLFIDQNGILLIADIGNDCVRKIDDFGIITTVAGNGVEGFEPGEHVATDTPLNSPFGIFVNGSGHLFIADTANHKIREVDSSNTLKTIAGRVSAIFDPFGFSGDGGSAVNARFWNPNDIYGDSDGNLYVANFINSRIRRIDNEGVIDSVVGGGNIDLSSDGIPASEASIVYPVSIFVDTIGNLFITEQGNHRIRKVNNMGIIDTVVGNGNAEFSGDNGLSINAGLNHPNGICLDLEGNLYIADTYNNRIRKVTFNTGVDKWNSF